MVLEQRQANRHGIDGKNHKALRIWYDKRTLSVSISITEITEINSHVYSLSVNEKDNASLQWGRIIFSISGAGSIRYLCGEKNKMLTPFHVHKKLILHGAWS